MDNKYKNRTENRLGISITDMTTKRPYFFKKTCPTSATLAIMMDEIIDAKITLRPSFGVIR